MKKAALLLALLVIAACFCWYIFDPDLTNHRVGYQSDQIQTLRPETTIHHNDGTAKPAARVTSGAIESSKANVISEEIPIPDGWTLVWQDEFDAPQLSMEYWTEIDRKDNFNGELQYYTTANSYIEDGCLVLTAKEEAKEDKKYTSGMVQTWDKVEMLYGRIEARISLPVAQGIFPAFWMTNNGDHHELDILEMVGCEPGNIYGVCHYWKHNRLVKTYGMLHIDNAEAFHVYALEWDETEVRWYIDGQEFFNTIRGVPAEDMYILLNLAVGGEWPGSPDNTTEFPIRMKVDYVRVFQREPQGGSNDLT